MSCNWPIDEAEGFRHLAPMEAEEARRQRREPAQGRERWVINKLRALMSWYSKGLDGGSHLRIRVNAATSIGELRDIVHEFFVDGVIVLARERTPTLV